MENHAPLGDRFREDAEEPGRDLWPEIVQKTRKRRLLFWFWPWGVGSILTLGVLVGLGTKLPVFEAGQPGPAATPMVTGKPGNGQNRPLPQEAGKIAGSEKNNPSVTETEAVSPSAQKPDRVQSQPMERNSAPTKIRRALGFEQAGVPDSTRTQASEAGTSFRTRRQTRGLSLVVSRMAKTRKGARNPAIQMEKEGAKENMNSPVSAVHPPILPDLVTSSGKARMEAEQKSLSEAPPVETLGQAAPPVPAEPAQPLQTPEEKVISDQRETPKEPEPGPGGMVAPDFSAQAAGQSKQSDTLAAGDTLLTVSGPDSVSRPAAPPDPTRSARPKKWKWGLGFDLGWVNKVTKINQTPDVERVAVKNEDEWNARRLSYGVHAFAEYRLWPFLSLQSGLGTLLWQDETELEIESLEIERYESRQDASGNQFIRPVFKWIPTRIQSLQWSVQVQGGCRLYLLPGWSVYGGWALHRVLLARERFRPELENKDLLKTDPLQYLTRAEVSSSLQLDRVWRLELAYQHFFSSISRPLNGMETRPRMIRFGVQRVW